MTTLPSFVELMSSLGLEQRTPPPPPPGSPHSSSPPSPSAQPPSPSVQPPSPTESRSSPSLRDTGMSRNRLARYSPYFPVFLSRRRGSLSSVSSSSSDIERPPRSYSTSPHPPSPRLRRRANRNLTVNVYGSTTDLSANTPISIYVRRKTPGASPTSPTFSREALDSPTASPMPFTLPTLPPLFPRSASSESFPLTPTSDVEASLETNSPSHNLKPLPDVSEAGAFMHRSRYHAGIRISTPPRSADLGERNPQHRIIAPIA